MKTAITIIVTFGVIIALVVYGTRETLKDQKPKLASRISLNTPVPKAAEKVRIIERVKVVEVPVTTIREKEIVERIVYVPEKPIVNEIHHEPAPVPTPAPRPVTCPAPQPIFIPDPQAIIIPAIQQPYRPTNIIPSPRRQFHPPIAPRAFAPEIRRGCNNYRAIRPNYRRY
jgi:hypothetical protein